MRHPERAGLQRLVPLREVPRGVRRPGRRHRRRRDARSAPSSRSRAAKRAFGRRPRLSGAAKRTTCSTRTGVCSSTTAPAGSGQRPTCCSSMARLSHALVLTAGLGTPTRPADARPRQTGGAGRRRAAGPPHHRAASSRSRVTDLVLNLHHLPATIAAVVGDGRDLGATVRYSWEQPADPRQRRRAQHTRCRSSTPRRSPIVNGDTLSDVDLSALAAAHARGDALVTLALTPNREPHKYGGVQMDATGEVTGFVPRGDGRRRQLPLRRRADRGGGGVPPGAAGCPRGAVIGHPGRALTPASTTS